MRPPLTGTRLEILDRLVAGQSIDHITEVGWYRRSWARTDVEAVAATWLAARPPDPRTTPKPAPTAKAKPKPRGKPPVAGERRGPAAQDIPHGTNSGYSLHYKRGIPYCDACRQAHSDHRKATRRKRSA